MPPFQKCAKHFIFDILSGKKENRLKIALQVSKLSFSPVVMLQIYHAATEKCWFLTRTCAPYSCICFLTKYLKSPFEVMEHPRPRTASLCDGAYGEFLNINGAWSIYIKKVWKKNWECPSLNGPSHCQLYLAAIPAQAPFVHNLFNQ